MLVKKKSQQEQLDLILALSAYLRHPQKGLRAQSSQGHRQVCRQEASSDRHSSASRFFTNELIMNDVTVTGEYQCQSPLSVLWYLWFSLGFYFLIPDVLTATESGLGIGWVCNTRYKSHRIHCLYSCPDFSKQLFCMLWLKVSIYEDYLLIEITEHLKLCLRILISADLILLMLHINMIRKKFYLWDAGYCWRGNIDNSWGCGDWTGIGSWCCKMKNYCIKCF